MQAQSYTHRRWPGVYPTPVLSQHDRCKEWMEIRQQLLYPGPINRHPFSIVYHLPDDRHKSHP